ncbi:hypothetical protein CORC01_08600 [Colletotrichum orchidophilum]|uniref:Uncharacterized protein n=1 Tax=Colletotrichum orchidophilum TaxID=1209926 RepID=A0A1G4B409_9PEZI|nr:uncharacterized protein CORC01_08600 [Colletotrichum orchidophilum]OHE96063.1 hypothetical protein CORC01_08600 [Colletotrichum orchidophilum]
MQLSAIAQPITQPSKPPTHMMIRFSRGIHLRHPCRFSEVVGIAHSRAALLTFGLAAWLLSDNYTKCDT